MGKIILIVDPNRGALAFLDAQVHRICQGKNVEVVWAMNLATAQSQIGQVALILTAVSIGGGTSFDLARLACARGIPVVLVDARPDNHPWVDFDGANFRVNQVNSGLAAAIRKPGSGAGELAAFTVSLREAITKYL